MGLCAEVCLKYGRCSGKCLNPESILYGEKVIVTCSHKVTASAVSNERAVTRGLVENIVQGMYQDAHFTLSAADAAEILKLLIDIHRELC